MHEHIQTIQDRCYAEVATAGHFLPTTLGLALVKGFHGYAKDWLDLAKVWTKRDGLMNIMYMKDSCIDSCHGSC